MVKVLVCGDREWTDVSTIRKWLIDVGATHIIEGGARGADHIAGVVAEGLELPVTTYMANWAEHHRAAGPIRNRLQLDTEQPDLVLAFHSNIAESKGTKDMVDYATKQGYEVMIICN